MRATFDPRAFRAAFDHVGQATPKRSTLPHLLSVKLVVGEDGTATMLGSDLERSVTATVPVESADLPGAALIDAERLRKILATNPDGPIAISSDNDNLVIRASGSRWALASSAADLYPEIPPPFGETVATIKAGILRRILTLTCYATDPDTSTYAVGGVTLEVSGDGQIHSIATDGRRIAHAFGACQDGSIPDIGTKFPVIPSKSVNILRSILADSDDDAPVAYHFDDNAAWFMLDGLTFYSRRLYGAFPRWRTIFGDKRHISIPVEAGKLRQAIDRAAVATSETSRAIHCCFAGANSSLSATSADVGDSAVPLDCVGPDESITIILDSLKFGEPLKHLGETDPVTLWLSDPNHVAVLAADGFEYGMMPMTKGA